MIGTQREERSEVRFLTTVPVVIYAGNERHVGLVRDFSPKGLFVYSDFEPDCGAKLSFTLRVRKPTVKQVVVNCRGNVVRVERAGLGAAIGIAVAVEEYEFRRLAPSLQTTPGE
jgi:PilZ domain